MSQDLSNLDSYTLPRAKYGDSGIIKRLLDLVDAETYVSLDFGCVDGYLDGHGDSNTRYLSEFGFHTVLWNDCPPIGRMDFREFVTAENVNDLMLYYQVPNNLDVLSIDVDGNDFWIWKAMDAFPRVLVIEFNGSLGMEVEKTIPYDPDFRYSDGDWHGASYALLKRYTEQERGYRLVHVSKYGNMIFLRNDLRPDLETPYIPPFTPWSHARPPYSPVGAPHRQWTFPYQDYETR